MTKIIKDTNDFDGFKCDKIVCVVTHKRQDFIDKWLRAWNNANKFGCAIAVFHAIDEENSTAEQEKQNILNHLPDFYVPFKNSHLKDLAEIRFACQQMLEAVDWKYLFWFTDDMLPMRKEFLSPFLEKINEPEAREIWWKYYQANKEAIGKISDSDKEQIIQLIMTCVLPADALAKVKSVVMA